MNYLRTLYESLSDNNQNILKKGYEKLTSKESYIINQLLDTRIIPTLNRQNLKSHPEIDYYTYNKGNRIHEFRLPSVSENEITVRQNIKKRINKRDDICTMYNEEIYTVRCHESFVAAFSNVTIFGPHAIVRTNKGEFPLEVRANIRRHPPVDFDSMLYDTARRSGRFQTIRNMITSGHTGENVDIVTSLLTGRINSTPAWGHWLLEVLPRIQGIKHYTEQTGQSPKIFINPEITDWQLKSLKLLGVDPKDLIMWDGGIISAREYILPKWGKSEWCLHEINWVKKQFENELDWEQYLDDFPRRIFLSRKNMERRNLLNEQKIMEELSSYGFEAYSPESLSFAKQIALYKNADILVGSSGSSFANMIFSSDLEIVELFPPDSFTWMFFELAQVLGFDYYLQMGNNVREDSSPYPQFRDFTVAPNQIGKIIDSLK